MRDIIKTSNFDMVIPTVHEELSLLATFANELPAKVLLSPSETLDIGDDKLKAYEWMQQNFPAYTASFVSLADWTTDWSSATEFFIKPRVGRGGRGCRRISKDELVFLKEKNESLSDWIVMELLEGKEWTVDVYVAASSNVVYVVPRERLGLAGGISIKGRTVRHEEIIIKTRDLLTKLEVKGPACIQWKTDASGAIYFVEINPRFSGGLMISAAGGIDPVMAIIADIQETELKEQLWQETTVVGYLDYHNLKTN
jgi:carbamoyl-phosphate synthase large subunit